MEENNKYDFVNSKALFVLKIITMSFAILAFAVAITVMLSKWIMDIDGKIKESNTKMAKAAARLNRFRKDRIKHILRQRKLQIKEEKEDKKRKNFNRDKKLTDPDIDDMGDIDEDIGEDCEEITDEENAINDFDNELRDIMLEDEDDMDNGHS